MTHPFVPHKTLAVCTYQVGWGPQQLVWTRPPPKVVHECQRPMLTIEDRNTEKGFKCKDPVATVGVWLALAGGVILGAIAMATPIGWIAVGVCAACVVGGMAITAKATSHVCTSMLKAGKWLQPHPDVSFDGFLAITQLSILHCKQGGFVRPVFDPGTARTMAKKIAFYNSLDLGAATLAAGGLGFLIPGAVAQLRAAGLVGGSKLFATGVLKIGVGIAVVGGLANLQARWMRDDEDLQGNETYKLMNERDPVGILPELNSPDDISNIDDVVVLTEMMRQARVIQPDPELHARLQELKNLGRAELRKSAAAAKLRKDLRAGKYPDVTKQMGEFRKVLRPAKIKEIYKINSNRRVWNIRQAIKGRLAKATFFLPFISVFGSERARKIFAEGITGDVDDETIHAVTPTGGAP